MADDNNLEDPYKSEEIKCVCGLSIGAKYFYKKISKKGRDTVVTRKEFWESADKEQFLSGSITTGGRAYCISCYKKAVAEYKEMEEKRKIEKEQELDRSRVFYKKKMQEINDKIAKSYFRALGQSLEYFGVIGVVEEYNNVFVHIISDRKIRLPKDIIYDTDAPIIKWEKGRKSYALDDFYDLPRDPDAPFKWL